MRVRKDSVVDELFALLCSPVSAHLSLGPLPAAMSKSPGGLRARSGDVRKVAGFCQTPDRPRVSMGLGTIARIVRERRGKRYMTQKLRSVRQGGDRMSYHPITRAGRLVEETEDGSAVILVDCHSS